MRNSDAEYCHRRRQEDTGYRHLFHFSGIAQLDASQLIVEIDERQRKQCDV